MARNHRDPLGELPQEALDAILRNDLASFLRAAFREVVPGVNLVWDEYLDLICARLAKVVTGDTTNLIITIPPRHLKSLCVSVALPAFYLGHNPSAEVMVVSYGQDLARKFAEDNRRVMISPFYRRIFETRLVSPRQSAQALRTTAGGVRRATSLDGVATGVGSDLLIFDDPQKPGEALSDATRRTTNASYEQTFLSRSNNPGASRTIIVMQRLHEDDFVGHVLGLGGHWEILNLPAIAEMDEAYPYETFIGSHTYRRREGEALHPTRVPLANLNEIRARMGEATWATQYQQRPAPPGGGIIKIEWFKRYQECDLPPVFDKIVQSWDTANTTALWSDYSVCTTWGTKGKHAYLLNVYRARMIYPDLKPAVLNQARLHGAKAILIEDAASGKQLLQELNRAGVPNLKACKPEHDKKTRMAGQTGPIENGFVHIPAEAHWLAEYLHELVVFPNGRFDDQVDSTSQALSWINNTQSSFDAWSEWARADMAKYGTIPSIEVWIISGPDDEIDVTMDGYTYQRHEDGFFHIRGIIAKELVDEEGWAKVGVYDQL